MKRVLVVQEKLNSNEKSNRTSRLAVDTKPVALDLLDEEKEEIPPQPQKPKRKSISNIFDDFESRIHKIEPKTAAPLFSSTDSI